MFNSINIASYNYFLLFQTINIHAVIFLILIINSKKNQISIYNKKIFTFLLTWIISGLPLSIFFLIKIIFIFKINSNIVFVHTLFIIINTLIIIVYFNWIIGVDLEENKIEIKISYKKLLFLVLFLSINFVFNMLLFYFI